MNPAPLRSNCRIVIPPRASAPPETTAVDLEQARQFLKALDPLADKHYFQTFGDGEKNSKLVSQQFASLDDDADRLTGLNQSGAGVFVTINQTNGEGRTAKDIERIRAIYLDFDDDSAVQRVEELSQRLQPSMIVESSPGLRHVYFLVEDMPIEDAGRWLKHLIALFGSDPACSDISRVLRVPGFFHRKGAPFMTRLLPLPEVREPYTVSDLTKAFGLPLTPSKAPDRVQGTAVKQEGGAGPTFIEGGRNSALASLAGTMRSRGISEPAIFAALSVENAARCVPPLEEAEVKSIASSIASYAPSTERLSITGETVEQVVARLAALGMVQYDQVRKAEAKSLNIRQNTLDKLVLSERGEGGTCIDAPFTEVEPWDTPVQAGELLDEICRSIRRHIICDAETAVAATLWVAMTYFVDQFDIVPLAVITAPEPRCGKSEFRRLFGRLVNRPVHADGMSASVLFRGLDLWKPTLLVDEYDTFVNDDEHLRGVFNAGHERDGVIWRCVGEEHTPTRFNVFGPKLLAGIGKLPATISDRSILLELRRKLPTEQITRQRDIEPSFFEEIRQKLMRFSDDYSAAVGVVRPLMPSELHDRQQDNWEPLFQIAHVAGGEWPGLVVRSALKLSKAKEDLGSRRIELLRDIEQIFEACSATAAHLSTTELIQFLCVDTEMPWATYYKGQPITPRQLANLLKEFGIASASVRTGATTAKGYQRAQFEDVFARYLNAH